MFKSRVCNATFERSNLIKSHQLAAAGGGDNSSECEHSAQTTRVYVHMPLADCVDIIILTPLKRAIRRHPSNSRVARYVESSSHKSLEAR